MELGVAGVNCKSSKRRTIPVAVNPPRIPTPMPAPSNNNTRSHTEKIAAASIVCQETTHQLITKTSYKVLDNDIKVAWINPRLISKVDMQAITSQEYNSAAAAPAVAAAVTTTTFNLNGQQPCYNRNNVSPVASHNNHQQHQRHQQQRPPMPKSQARSGESEWEMNESFQVRGASVLPIAPTAAHHRSAMRPAANTRAPATGTTSKPNASKHVYKNVPSSSHRLNPIGGAAATAASVSMMMMNKLVTNSQNNVSSVEQKVRLYHAGVSDGASVVVDRSASGAGSAGGFGASALGSGGVYSETRYAFAVNGMPGNPAQASAAAAFFARAAQKLNLSASPHRRKRVQGDEESVGGGFCGALQRTPPPVPPALLRRIGVKEITGVGKVKVMLRVSTPPTAVGGSTESSCSNSFFSLDKRKKQVTLVDPSSCGTIAPEDRRVGVAAPKMFAFDAIFGQDDSQTEVCSSALTDVIHAVINGTDGCLFCFGHAGLGKSYTMLGTPENANTLGIIPCAISWLFRGINEQKQKTGARFSVRVSAVEVCGPTNQLRDLLNGHASESEQSPGMYLCDNPLLDAQPHCELRVPSAERAAHYLDCAVECRGSPGTDTRDSHLLFTLHVYQYSVAGKGGVAGGRSRLHLIDLGNSERSKSSGGIPLSGLGNILLAIFNGQKHLPYKEHKLTHLLKDCLSSLTCHAAMIAHVSPYAQNYSDTLTTVQLASRIHRMRRRKIKFVSAATGNGSGGSSSEEATRTTGTSSEPDPSSSDLSADTVIYVGPADDATDGEHPPVYIPSLNSGDNRCSMSKVLRGSSAEQRPTASKPQKTTTEEKTTTHRTPIKTCSQSNKTSPAHTNSPKSSPVRVSSGKGGKPESASSKIPVFGNTSDEQWIDGPRISKSKVAEARHFMKEACHVKKRETWIDGPMQKDTVSALAAQTSVGYGYMDNHKKSMIRKWVENQSTQLQPKTKHSPSRSVDQKGKEAFKEMTQFKTCDDAFKEIKPLVENECKKTVEESHIRTGLKLLSNMPSDDCIPECRSPEEQDNQFDRTDIDYEDDEEVVEIPPALPLIQPLSSREVSMESLDVRIKEHSMYDDYNEDLGSDEDEILEIIEVEEPLEPVPTQDCCLQVTEEDIALSMMAFNENPLPEVDQENPLDHPLRILSQENLTVVSTFTDSMSVFTDLERIMPRTRYNTRYYNDDYEDPDVPNSSSFRNGNINVVESTSTNNKFEELARLHELYTSRLAKANVIYSETYQQQHQQGGHRRSLTRCESLSLSDMLYGVGVETSSIYSEPAYVPNEDKFCENCKVNMVRPATAQNWYTDQQHHLSASTTELDQVAPEVPLGGRFQRYSHKYSKENFSLASLRHPDGASNPNLKEETERIPGNGAAAEQCDMSSKSELPVTLPPLLSSNEKLNRRMLSIDAIKLNQKQSEEYDSGHDSTPRTSKHSPAAISRRAESGYDSVVRDSESSSIDSYTSRRLSHIQHRKPGVVEVPPWNSDIRRLLHNQLLIRTELAVAKAKILNPDLYS